jgi:hypothetical protein
LALLQAFLQSQGQVCKIKPPRGQPLRDERGHLTCISFPQKDRSGCCAESDFEQAHGGSSSLQNTQAEMRSPKTHHTRRCGAALHTNHVRTARPT